jgi:hypothetical protein
MTRRKLRRVKIILRCAAQTPKVVWYDFAPPHHDLGATSYVASRRVPWKNSLEDVRK